MSVPVADRRLVLEAPVPVADGAGGWLPGWQPRAVVWAALRPGTGRGRAGAEAVALGVVPWRIVLRAMPAGHPARPRPGQRLRAGARVWLIRAVAEADGRGAWLVCHAEEEVPA